MSWHFYLCMIRASVLLVESDEADEEFVRPSDFKEWIDEKEY